mmetsp:Transcript_39623/g.98116  ORF Transcript_39623/g.98116 Transcript_39623/m.98116 type:complete len:210 (-) Transcript_39623:60-689(-)
MMRSVDAFDLEREHQHGAGADLGPAAARAVAQLGGDEQLPLGALAHQAQRLRPAADHLLGRERRGLAALVGRVELRAVDERAAVVAGARRVGRDAAGGPGPRLHHAVLQPRRQRHHPLLLGVGLQPGAALGGGAVDAARVPLERDGHGGRVGVGAQRGHDGVEVQRGGIHARRRARHQHVAHAHAPVARGVPTWDEFRDERADAVGAGR